jgi:hypothetical protein
LATGADRRRDRPVASTTTGVRLAELLGRLSLAFDIANGAGYGKACARPCWRSSWVD